MPSAASLQLLRRNVAAAVFWLAAAALVDLFAVRTRHLAVELELAGLALGAVAIALAATAIYIANKPLFAGRGWSTTSKVAFVTLAMLLLYYGTFLPLLWFHVAIGGQL